MKNLVVLTGAGMSAESGIKTFRDSDGLWEHYPVQQVASIEGWYQNPKLMLQFYNERRTQLQKAAPNKGHLKLAAMEQDFHIQIVTQNIDNLHERAGSTRVLHLHGELTKAQSVNDPDRVIDIGYESLHWGDKGPDGAQLRPHIVWFGEAVPNISAAAEFVSKADILVIIGTSMVVYPAAGLIHYASSKTPIYVIDPRPAEIGRPHIHYIREKAGQGVETLCQMLTQEN